MASYVFEPHEHELRDPTREELYTGPKREKLPIEIQQMAVEDTACTFCGVSYFVFAEVQELQATVKKYKKTFHDFVRFLERERKISQDLKIEIVELKTSFEQISGTFASNAKHLAAECAQLRQGDAQSSSKLFDAHRELAQQQDKNQQLQSQMKRAEEEWRIASSLTEQKLRNEILHLSSQVEKCKLLPSTQEVDFTAAFEREKRKMKELEARFAESRESWTSAERLLVTERDQMKQKLFAMTERVEEERNAAKGLESQLKAVQQELSRIASSNDAERATFSHLNSEVIMLKHQLHSYEKNKAVLLSERAHFQEEKAKNDELIPELRLQVGALQKKIEENVLATERIKQDYVKELEKARVEHANDLNRLQRDHAKAIEELKVVQREYVEFLKKETSEIQQGVQSTKHTVLDLEKQLRDAERQVSHWRDQTERAMEELQHVRLGNAQSKSLADALEKKIATLEDDKRELERETETLERELDLQKTRTRQQVDSLQQEMLQTQQQLESQKLSLQKRVDAVQAKLELVEAENARRTMSATTPAPQVAWGDTKNEQSSSESPRNLHGENVGSSNQESHDHERTIEKLRLTLAQKEREISLLQQTVHRECLERTSLLEKMRSGKILPDMGSTGSIPVGGEPSRRPRKSVGVERETTSNTDEDEASREPAEHPGTSAQPKASFYEKLRKAGQRKPKSRK